ncbi:MAG: aminomethyl-transferring glycine dehydrogenase subunit GcvPA [Clostridia bacterium]|nr:aminomethyl-transferring glycine dehydrogenase subunit GcvPA [Clostridia bacterium]
MGSYIPSSVRERQEMLDFIGVKSIDELFAVIPEKVRFDRALDIPKGLSEMEVRRVMGEMAAKNTVFPVILRGAGAYDHHIPSIVKYIPAKEEFLTTYTPYQAEISQGVLQSIFEYQTMICQLTGMDVSNASVYDGASAAAEAVTMCRDRKRTKALVSGAAHPDVIETIRTYCNSANCEMVVVPHKNGVTDVDALTEMMTADSCCLYVQSPNFFGQIEDITALSDMAHGAGLKLIAGCNPIALAVLKTPVECGADIAVGEGQPLGMPLSYGGPYLGFMATSDAMARKLPGRIVGQTEDAEGKRAFVLTLQAREQHIRREKASSNICSNQALCALTASVYCSVMGPHGLKQVAQQCHSKAVYFANLLCKIPGVAMKYEGQFFHEFVTTVPTDAEKILAALAENGILGGLPVEGGILWCVTEKVTREDIERAAKIVEEVCA